MGLLDFFKKKPTEEQKEKLEVGLEQTRTSFIDKISKAVAGKSAVSEDFLDDLEEVLISSDVGVDTTVKIIERIEKRVAKDKYLGKGELQTMLQEEITDLLISTENSATETSAKPYVIMVVGVNGVGKDYYHRQACSHV